MVSGFFTSPKDHERMSFGDARVMRTEEKSLTRSYTLSAMWGSLRRRVEGGRGKSPPGGSARGGVDERDAAYRSEPDSRRFFSSVTLRPRPRSSWQSTSKATGMPASSVFAP